VQLRQLLVVEAARGGSSRKNVLPDGLPVRRIGKGKVDGEAQPALEGGVKQRAQIGGQNGQPLICLHALQQVADLDVGVAIVAVAYLAAFAEQGIGLVEEQQRSA